jgi:hypothetical protein
MISLSSAQARQRIPIGRKECRARPARGWIEQRIREIFHGTPLAHVIRKRSTERFGIAPKQRGTL